MNKEVKFCPSCKTTKKVSFFGKNEGRSDGLTSYCRMCRSQKRRTAPKGSTAELLELQSQVEQLKARIAELESENEELKSSQDKPSQETTSEDQKQYDNDEELVTESSNRTKIGFRPSPTNSSAQKNKNAIFLEVKDKLLNKHGVGTSVRYNKDVNCAEVWKFGNFVDFVEL